MLLMQVMMHSINTIENGTIVLGGFAMKKQQESMQKTHSCKQQQSIWQEFGMPRFPQLEGDVKTDVLIIGGGLCGVLCARLLTDVGVDCIVVEADRIGSGTTKNTTAKITSQHGLIYNKLLKTMGQERAELYLDANEHAVTQYRRLCKDLDCDFEEKSAYVYSTESKKEVLEELKAVHRLGFDANFCETLSLPFSVKGAIAFPNQAQLHPLKFLAGISDKLRIYEHTFIREIRPHKAWTNKGTISAKAILVTTHFPFLNKHGSYFLKLYQQRSYVLALRHAQQVDGMYLDAAENGLSFRNYQDFLLLGGGGHRTGKQGGNWTELKAFAEKYYPDADICYSWAAQDCMSLDDVPYIGRYAARTPDLYVATGFCKWGMTSAMVASEVLTDLVLGKKNEFTQLFSPQRSILKPQLFVNGAETVKNLLTPTAKRCPHLGCALKWNPAEHTWDCPCHGSRFTEDGDLLDNPATGNAKV